MSFLKGEFRIYIRSPLGLFVHPFILEQILIYRHIVCQTPCSALMIMINKTHLRQSQGGWGDIRSDSYEYMLT